jgi:hypothetical protein
MLLLSGRVDYRHSVGGDRITVTDVRSVPTARVLVDGVPGGDPAPLDGTVTSVSFTCSGDRLTEHDGDRLTVVYERVS